VIGSIVAAAPSLAAPYCFLSKVTGIHTFVDSVRVDTQPASLAEVISDGDLSFTAPLVPQGGPSQQRAFTIKQLSDNTFALNFLDTVIYDADGNPATTYDQVRASGSLTLTPTLYFTCNMSHFVLHAFDIGVGMQHTGALGLSVGETATLVQQEFVLGSIPMRTVVWFVGPLPIVITPYLDVVARLDGTLTAKASVSIREGVTTRFDAVYSETSGLSGSSSVTFAPTAAKPAVVLGGTIKGSLGPRLDLRLYGVGMFTTNVRGYLNLDVNVLRDPLYVLSSGVEATLGCAGHVLDRKVFDLGEATVFDKKVVLLSGANLSISCSPQAPRAGHPVIISLSRDSAPPVIADDVKYNFAFGDGAQVSLSSYDPQPHTYTAAGNYTVTAQMVEPSTTRPLSPSVSVSFAVSADSASRIVMAPTSAAVVRGETLPVQAAVFDASGTAITGLDLRWSSDDATIASVQGSGESAVVTGHGAGMTTIHASIQGVTGDLPVQGIVHTLNIQPSPAQVELGRSIAFSAYDENGMPVSPAAIGWRVEFHAGRSIVLVDPVGKVTGWTPGAGVVRAIWEGDTTFVNVSVPDPDLSGQYAVRMLRGSPIPGNINGCSDTLYCPMWTDSGRIVVQHDHQWGGALYSGSSPWWAGGGYYDVVGVVTEPVFIPNGNGWGHQYPQGFGMLLPAGLLINQYIVGYVNTYGPFPATVSLGRDTLYAEMGGDGAWAKVGSAEVNARPGRLSAGLTEIQLRKQEHWGRRVAEMHHPEIAGATTLRSPSGVPKARVLRNGSVARPPSRVGLN
jgi:hypothetical protein